MVKYIKILNYALWVMVAAVLIVLAAAVFYLKSDLFLDLVLSKVNARIPGNVLVGNHKISFLNGEVELRDGVLKDPEAGEVAGFESLQVRVSYSSLLHGEILIKELIIENPKTYLKIEKDGRLNLLNVFREPKRGSGESAGKRKKQRGIPFNIVIKECDLIKGDFRFEMAKSGFSSSVSDINIHASGDLREQSAQVKLNAKESTIDSNRLNFYLAKPLTVKGNLNHSSIESLSIEVGTADSEIKLSGDIHNIFSKPDVYLLAELNISLEDMQKSFLVSPRASGQVKGELAVSGTFDAPSAYVNLTMDKGKLWDYEFDHTVLDLKLNKFAVVCDTLKFIIFKSPVDITGNIDLKNVFPNGYFSSVRDFHALEYQLNIKQENTRLENLPWLKNRLQGIIDSELDLKGKGIAYNRLDAQGDLQLSVRHIRSKNWADKIVDPIEAELDAALRLKNGFLSIDCINANAGSIEIYADGDMDLHTGSVRSNLKIDAPELERVLSAVGLKGISGKGVVQANVSGRLKDPRVELILSANDLSVPHISIGNVLATGVFSKGKITIDHALVQNNQSRLDVQTSVHIFDLPTFKVRKSPEFDITIFESTVFAEDFSNLGKGKFIVSGNVAGNMKNLSGSLSLNGEDVDVGVQKFSRIVGDIIFDDQKIRISPVTVDIAGKEVVTANGWISFDKQYQIDLTTQKIPIKDIDWIKERESFDGLLECRLKGKGSFKNPLLTGDLFLTKLSVQEQQVENFHLHLDVKDFMMFISGRIDADINGTLDLSTHEFSAELTGKEIDLTPYFNMFGLDRYSGYLSGKINIKGDLDHLTQVQARADISHLRTFHNQLKFADAGPFEVFYENRIASIPRAQILILNTSKLDISGSVDLEGPISFKAQGQIPLNTLSLYVDELFDITGNADIQADITGTITAPVINGELVCSDIEFTIPKLYQRLHAGKGTIHFANDKIVIDELAGKIDTGDFNIWGSMDIEGFKPAFMDLNLKASTLPVYVPNTMDLILSANLNVKGSQEKNAAKGELVLLEGVYYKNMKLQPLDILKNVAIKTSNAKISSPDMDLPFLKNMTLDIDVKQRSPLLVDNNLAQLSMHTEVNVTGGPARPVISGQTKIDEGVVFYLGKEFTVNNGRIEFTNPYKTEPYIDVEGVTEVRDWEIKIIIVGTVDQLGVRFTSKVLDKSIGKGIEELSQEDIILVLLVGKTRNELENPGGQNDNFASRSTSKILAGLVASTFENEVKKTTGLDIIEVETEEDMEEDSDDDDETPENGNSSRVKVTLGKQLTKRLTMKYTVESKDGEVNQEVLSEYKFIENIILNGFYDTQGKFGGEFVYRLEFR